MNILCMKRSSSAETSLFKRGFLDQKKPAATSDRQPPGSSKQEQAKRGSPQKQTSNTISNSPGTILQAVQERQVGGEMTKQGLNQHQDSAPSDSGRGNVTDHSLAGEGQKKISRFKQQRRGVGNL